MTTLILLFTLVALGLLVVNQVAGNRGKTSLQPLRIEARARSTRREAAR